MSVRKHPGQWSTEHWLPGAGWSWTAAPAQHLPGWPCCFSWGLWILRGSLLGQDSAFLTHDLPDQAHRVSRPLLTQRRSGDRNYGQVTPSALEISRGRVADHSSVHTGLSHPCPMGAVWGQRTGRGVLAAASARPDPWLEFYALSCLHKPCCHVCAFAASSTENLGITELRPLKRSTLALTTEQRIAFPRNCSD